MRTAEAVKALEIRSDVDFSALPREELEAMAAAGREVLDIHRINR